MMTKTAKKVLLRIVLSSDCPMSGAGFLKNTWRCVAGQHDRHKGE